MKNLYTKYGCAAQFLLIMTWLTNMKDSYAYFFTYALCALAGILCICDNCNHQEDTGSKWKEVVCPALIFSVAVVLANHKLYTPISAIQSVFYLVIDIFAGMVIAGNVLICLYRKLPIAVVIQENNRNHPLRFFLLCFGSVVIIDLLFLVFNAFPGILTADSMDQMRQIHTGRYNNVNPFWHTQTIGIFVKLGKMLFGSYQAGVAMFSVFQILFMAVCFAYVLVTLYQRHIPWGWIAGSWVAYALIPYNIAYSVTMWKDILFSAASLLMTTALYRILSNIKQTKKLDLLLFILGSLGLCLWRTNGLLAYGVLFLVMLCMAAASRKLVRVMAVIFVVCACLNGPFLSILGAEGGDYVEALSIPLQQVARVVSEEKTLEQRDLELLETIADEETIRQTYREEISNPVKMLIQGSAAKELIAENPIPYLKLWMRLGFRYPGEYMKAWIEQTKGYWNGGYAYYIWADGIYENDLGIYSLGNNNLIGKLFTQYLRYQEMIVFLHPIISIGLYTWIAAMCWTINRKKNRKEWVLLLPSFVILVGLLIGTPVYAEFRYAYPIMLSCPLILCATWFCPEEES